MKNLFLLVVVGLIGLTGNGCASGADSPKSKSRTSVVKASDIYVRTPPMPSAPTPENPDVYQTFVLPPHESVPECRLAPLPRNRSYEQTWYEGGTQRSRWCQVVGGRNFSEVTEVRSGRWVTITTVHTYVTASYGEWKSVIVPTPPAMYYEYPSPPKGGKWGNPPKVGKGR